jgi:hypothetical protein
MSLRQKRGGIALQPPAREARPPRDRLAAERLAPIRFIPASRIPGAARR